MTRLCLDHVTAAQINIYIYIYVTVSAFLSEFKKFKKKTQTHAI